MLKPPSSEPYVETLDRNVENPLRTIRPRTDEVASNTEVVSKKGLRRAYVSQWILTAAPLLCADLLGFGVALGLANGMGIMFGVSNAGQLLALVPFMAAMAMCLFAGFSLYPGTGLHPALELRKITVAVSLTFATMAPAVWVWQGNAALISIIISAWLISLIMVPLLRGAVREQLCRFRWWGQPLLIIGDKDTASRVYRHFLSHPELGLRPLEAVNHWAAGDARNEAICADRLRALRNKHHLFWAIVTNSNGELSGKLVEDYASTFPHVGVVSPNGHLPAANQLVWGGSASGVLFTNRLLLPLPRIAKLLLEYSVVLVGGLCCLPLIAVLAVLIKLTSRGPVFYAQKRIGKGMQAFWAWKFRTMRVDADQVLQDYLDSDPKLREEWERDHKLKNDPRVTLVGRLLRKTSLDELPQLWNILRGEMSLIGPRPIVTAEIPKYRESFELYTRVKPGITGLWQVSGRNNTTYDERVNLDTFYVLNWSPWLDLYILIRTIKVVLFREGAY